MSGPVKTLLFGLVDPGQAADAGRLGIDGAVLQVGGDGPLALSPAAAAAVGEALPPLAARLALAPDPGQVPAGFQGFVCGPEETAHPPGWRRIVRLTQEQAASAVLDPPPSALWVLPRPEGSSAVVRFDFQLLERLGCRLPLILEIPDGAAGIEAVVRITRPYAVLLGEAAWFRPGIVDLDRLEKALAVIARFNKPGW